MNKTKLTTKTGSAELFNIEKPKKLSEMTSDADKKRSRFIAQPAGTISYTVENRDTIEKLALRFNSTPSEILHINKLISRTIFPGQVLFVPDRTPNDEEKVPDEVINQTNENLSHRSPSSPQIPGRAHRLNTDSSFESLSSENSTETQRFSTLNKSLSNEDEISSDDEFSAGFLKTRAKLILKDRKSINGTFLITPSAVLFDPDVHEPVLDSSGLTNHALLIRIERLMHLVVYDDIAFYDYRVSLRDDDKRHMFHSSSVKSRPNANVTHLSFDNQRVKRSLSSEFNKSDQTNVQTRLLFDVKPNEQTNLIDNQTSIDFDDFHQIHDEYKRTIEILSDQRFSSSFDLFRFQRAVRNSDEDKFNCSLSSVKTAEKPEYFHRKEVNYIRMHPIEIPSYLRIKVRPHIHETSSLKAMNRKKSNEFIYKGKDLEEEFWFCIPREKKDSISKFLLRWTPSDSYHETKTDSDRSETSSSPNGFVLLVNDDPELDVDVNSNFNDKHKTIDLDHYLKHRNSLIKDWEIVNVDEIYRRFNRETIEDKNFDFRGIRSPTFLQPSTLLSDEQSKQILIELPARIQMLNWSLEFSTEANGFSLNQLYRRSTERDRDDPSLLIVKDIEGNIFGAFISHQILISEGFYGNGETFLFTFFPTFQAFHWSGTNEFFVKGDLHSLGIGTGEGKYGLWIDGELYRGRTCSTKTFDNDPLTNKEDFTIASVELWTFVD